MDETAEAASVWPSAESPAETEEMPCYVLTG
jgi:hypothetical protein